MKQAWLCLITTVLVLPLVSEAEPIAMEQAANVTGHGGIEAGLDANYFYRQNDWGSCKLENSTLDLPLFVRAGIPALEGKLTLPYGMIKYQNADFNYYYPKVWDTFYSGFKDLEVMLKTDLLTGLVGLPGVGLALGVDLSFPTGDSTEMLGMGFNVGPFLAVGIDISPVKLYANVGYRYRSKYSEGNYEFPIILGGLETVEITGKPGDVIHFAAGLELAVSDLLSLHAECIGANYGEYEIEFGDQVYRDIDTQSEVFVVPGMRFQTGPFKAKLGIRIPLHFNAFANPYWNIVSGVSLRLL